MFLTSAWWHRRPKSLVSHQTVVWDRGGSQLRPLSVRLWAGTDLGPSSKARVWRSVFKSLSSKARAQRPEFTSPCSKAWAPRPSLKARVRWPELECSSSKVYTKIKGSQQLMQQIVTFFSSLCALKDWQRLTEWYFKLFFIRLKESSRSNTAKTGN